MAVTINLPTKFFASFVISPDMSKEELEDISQRASYGYAYHTKASYYRKSDYKKAYTYADRLLNVLFK